MLIRSFAYQPNSCNGYGMVPTLLPGDYFYSSKFDYGYSRFSLSFHMPLISDAARLLSRPIRRGDVVIIVLRDDEDTEFVTRIMGLPGDRIQVTDGTLYINGTSTYRTPVGPYTMTYPPAPLQTVFGTWRRDDITRESFEYIETLPNGRQHAIITNSKPFNNTPVYRVPPGHYFALGDNRDTARDSRSFGYIPSSHLIGTAQFVFFSDPKASVFEVWKWSRETRFDRIFAVIN